MPTLHRSIAKIIPGEHSDIAAGAVVRIAISHYVLGAGNPDRFLAELRLAAGLDPGRRRRPRRNATAS